MQDPELTNLQSLLCTLLSEDNPEVRAAAARRVWEVSDQEQIFALAHANGVAPVLAHALLDGCNSLNIPAFWLQVHGETYHRISAYLSELDRLAALLAEEGITLVALKNGGIARGIYPCVGCCPMDDLDVLVEKQHFQAVHKILLTEGYHFEFRSPWEGAELEAAERGGGAEYWKILPGGEKLWFELQWRPVAGRWIRPDQEPTAQELIARSMPIPESAVRLLSPEDNLMQVALHTAKHSYVRAPGFRLHLDVDRIVRLQQIDWELFLSRVLTLQVKTAVFFSLVVPSLLFETPVPSDVLARLHPRAWKERLISRWLQRAGLFNTGERKFSKSGFILFNILLYDDLKGLLRGVFPRRAWMRHQYTVRSDFLLLYYYLFHIVNLAFRRLNI